MSAARINGGEAWFERDTIELNIETDGPVDGAPVVFLHGVSASTKTYEWLPAEITGERRIIRVDLRGHGESDHAPGTYSIDRYSRDVAELVRAVAARPAVIVGHSLGGVVAWWLAQRHPELVAAAFLEDPPLYLGEPDEFARTEIVRFFPLMRDRATAWRQQAVDASAAAEQIGADPIGPDPSVRMRDVVFDDALVAMADAQLRMDPDVLTSAADAGMLATTDTTAPVIAPMMILAADDAYGAVFSSAHEQRLARAHPDVEVVRVMRAGHLIHDGRASRDTYVEHLARFLHCHA